MRTKQQPVFRTSDGFVLTEELHVGIFCTCPSKYDQSSTIIECNLVYDDERFNTALSALSHINALTDQTTITVLLPHQLNCPSIKPHQHLVMLLATTLLFN